MSKSEHQAYLENMFSERMRDYENQLAEHNRVEGEKERIREEEISAYEGKRRERLENEKQEKERQ